MYLTIPCQLGFGGGEKVRLSPIVLVLFIAASRKGIFFLLFKAMKGNLDE